MPRILPQCYQEWRVRFAATVYCRETREGLPSERLLQRIWLHQRLRRDQLRLLDGRPVHVLHPGFWNRERGPDFRRAVVQIGDDSPRRGDIEIDLRPNAWHGHGHDRNPVYRGVILHVVWDGATACSDPLPVLPLQHALDAPLAELCAWLNLETGLPPSVVGRCARPLRGLAPEDLDALLHQASRVRLERKGEELAARARQAGWEQALWEGLFGALGYRHNVWPMRRLAELLPEIRGVSWDNSVLILQARLLGLSGLLPVDLTRTNPEADTYLRTLWDLWWRDQGRLANGILPRPLWRLDGVRPANHPHRRLALAAHWVEAGALPSRLESWLQAEVADRDLACSLQEVLQVVGDPFWSWHRTLVSTRLAAPQPLLGPARTTDLAVNVILPWLWIRAATGGHTPLRERLEHRFFAWPASEDNAVLRQTRLRLLAGGRDPAPPTAARQQGFLQIARDFCDHADALCADCPFPDLVSSTDGWGATPAIPSSSQSPPESPSA